MNMVFQLPRGFMIMGMGHDAGFAEVPDARPARNILEGFMSTMFMSICAAAGTLKSAARNNLELGTSADRIPNRQSMTDAARFTEIYRQHSLKIFRFALHMSGSPTIAEEVTQETFLVIIHQPGSFDPARGAIGSFLYGVARNFVRQHLDRDRRFEQVDEGEDEEIASGEDILGDLTRRENVQVVRDAILGLPPKYREVVVLCDLQEMSYEAAAELLDCAIGTVRSRLHRARNLLMMKLQTRCLA
jgi:RNA polymerase sigma-70 factor (ECF subfamily)